MELIGPKAKKGCKLPIKSPLPVILKKDGTIHKFKGLFTGFSVIIEDEEDMKNLISMGYFGKATFSRSYPQFTQNKTEIIRARQYERRKEWADKMSGKKILKKVIVVPDSDEETETYFTNLNPQYKIDSSSLKESVWMSLEEAFFLMNTVNCLNIYHEDQHCQPDKIWKLFSETDQTKQWIVKPVLYKQGPAFYHASYVVIIDLVDENFKRIEKLSRRNMDNVSLLSLNRLCETAGKELLIFSDNIG
ncbi:hypothetical protein NQ317_018481 [Molorchus minor]|uniref:Uncharacterized protein n=1 Tax=Molorchus minor TaxID=1323400 RepID=A0ABQ9J3T6_9CUCU|nr:hypothetical protein NQ317_018481 [Molorchus minor]